MTYMRVFVSFLVFLSLAFGFSGCKKPASTLKVFVRDENTKLVTQDPQAEVTIVSDPSSSPATSKFTAKAQTNSAGFATFDLTDFFKVQYPTAREGYFDIIVSRTSEAQGTGNVRVTYQTTSVTTVYLK